MNYAAHGKIVYYKYCNIPSKQKNYFHFKVTFIYLDNSTV